MYSRFLIKLMPYAKSKRFFYFTTKVPQVSFLDMILDFTF